MRVYAFALAPFTLPPTFTRSHPKVLGLVVIGRTPEQSERVTWQLSQCCPPVQWILSSFAPNIDLEKPKNAECLEGKGRCQ